MAEEQNEEKVVLKAPVALDDESFKTLLVNNLEENQQDYLNELALNYGLDINQNHKEVLDIAYDQQVVAIQENCIHKALAENTLASYKILNDVCFFNDEDISYMSAVEGENLPASLSTYIEERLKNVSDLQLTLSMTKDYNETLLYVTNDIPDFTTYKANQLVDKISGYDSELSDDEKAKSYFIASKLYRKLASKANPYNVDMKPSETERKLLHKVLTLSSDYNLIACCQERLPEKEERKLLIRAYKNALKKKNRTEPTIMAADIEERPNISPKEQRRKELYNINSALATLYRQNTDVVGFPTANSEKVISGEKSIRYSMEAYRYANKEDRLPLLQNVASTQMIIGDTAGWENTKMVIAQKFFKGEDRCMAYNAIGDKSCNIAYYRKAIEECEKMRAPALTKLNVLEITYGKIAHHARDKAVIQEAEEKLADVKAQKLQKINSMIGVKTKD